MYVLGRSGTGKSFSIRNFNKGEVGIVNVQGKILPFKGSGKLDIVNTDNSAEIVKAIELMSKKYKAIVVDDFQYVMANEFMRRATERGYDKFTEIARHAWDIANVVQKLPADVIVYIMCHTDTDQDGFEKLKTIGRLLDEKIVLEGMSTIVLKTAVSDGEYMFLTQNSGKDTVKSPSGMFLTYAIDNDLKYVDEKIRNYYEIGEYKDDEEIAQMDQAVEKAEIAKPDGSGRKRRKKDSEIKQDVEAAGTGTVDGQGTVSKSAPITDPDAESASGKPKTRRRKDRSVKDEEVIKEPEKASEQPENASQKAEIAEVDKGTGAIVGATLEEQKALESEEAPKRRRRRKANTLTEADMKNEHIDITDDDLPF